MEAVTPHSEPPGLPANPGAEPGDSTADAEVCRAIVAATTDAVIYADREGRIRLWNHGAEMLFGHRAADVLGASLDVIIPEHLRAAHWKGYDAALASGRLRLEGRPLTTRSMHKDGHKLYVDLGFGLVRDVHGNIAGAFATGRDCTARHASEVELRARVAALEAASKQPAAPGTGSPATPRGPAGG